MIFNEHALELSIMELFEHEGYVHSDGKKISRNKSEVLLVDDLKEYAENYYTDEEYQSKIKKYSNHQPFTKESLLYREIFESFYPGMADMVKDFWMPNKNWQGCNVNDPSARVLSNYGDSGK